MPAFRWRPSGCTIREHAVTRDDITCFTTKIKCEHCGCNFRKQVSTMADGKKRGYWRCADRNGCTVKGLRDDFLRDMTAEVLGLAEFDEDVFLERIDRITVRDGTHLTFHFTDGGTSRAGLHLQEGKPSLDGGAAAEIYGIKKITSDERGAEESHQRTDEAT